MTLTLMMDATMSDTCYQCSCLLCYRDIWIDKTGVKHVICPHCGATLPNSDNYSNSDADEGTFATMEKNK